MRKSCSTASVGRISAKSRNWLFDVANEMDIENGVIWVCGVVDGAISLTDTARMDLEKTVARSRFRSSVRSFILRFSLELLSTTSTADDL